MKMNLTKSALFCWQWLIIQETFYLQDSHKLMTWSFQSSIDLSKDTSAEQEVSNVERTLKLDLYWKCQSVKWLSRKRKYLKYLTTDDGWNIWSWNIQLTQTKSDLGQIQKNNLHVQEMGYCTSRTFCKQASPCLIWTQIVTTLVTGLIF